MKLKWEGREAFVHIKPVNELLNWIPHFKRVPFSLHNGGTNKYLDNIIRESLSTDAEFIKDRQDVPVCTASKQYRLIQHRDVFKALVQAVKLVASDKQPLEATLNIAEYGEYMWVSFTLENHQLNKAEQFPLFLEVNGLNTIKPGTALDIRLSWYEPIYRTRIPYGMLSSQEVKFKKIKRKKKKELDSDIIADEIYSFLVNHLTKLSGEREFYNRWKTAEVNQRTLAHWIDNDVKNKWNYEKAARAYHIATEGYDIQVKTSEGNDEEQETDSTNKIPPPSELTPYLNEPRYYVQKEKVPEKFAPARNAFDLSLILSWITSQERTIPKQLKWVDITYLMERLVAADERLRFSLNVQERLFK